MPIAFCILLDFTASLISVWSGVRNLDELYIFGHLFGQVLEIYLVTWLVCWSLDLLTVLILLKRDKEIKLLSRNYLNIFNCCTLQFLILSSISVLLSPIKQLLYNLSMHDKYWEFHLFFTKEEDEVILHLLYSCPWAVKQLLYSLSMHDK